MIACLYSGGKDSALAVHRMGEMGRGVELLVTMVPENDFSYMFHKPNISFTPMQAKAMGIAQAMASTKGEKEMELEDLERALEENGVTELVTGAVASTYQRDRINAICGKLGIVHTAPLWGIDSVAELGEIARRFNAIVTRVSAEGLDQSFLGRRIDNEMIGRLIKINRRYKINMSFEGGEAESFVLDAPLFRKSIRITRSHVEWAGSAGSYVIDEAVLEDK